MAYFNLTEPVDVTFDGTQSVSVDGDVDLSLQQQPPYSAYVSSGNVPGWRFFTKFAQSSVVSTSYVDVWPNASILSYLTAAETMNLVSTDANDDLGDTGAEKVRIYGLNDLYEEIQEVVEMNGMSNVLTSNSYLRVYRMEVIQAGSTGSNEGTITATASSAGTVQAYIGVGTNQTLQSQYTVPANYYLFITDFHVAVQKADQAIIRGVVRPFGEVFQVKRTYNIYQQASNFDFTPPFPVPPKSDVSVRAIKISGTADVDVAIAYDGYLVDKAKVNL